ncbi:uroporphyrinogen decarboxylase [Aquipuribacter nitratireducens]|uniref:Uroporphyrinogen decarboxylase n=1 Tax=Aquipuribacter nitratireducens TaxID=650104 RepID=A0ABW0GS93_9MICO
MPESTTRLPDLVRAARGEPVDRTPVWFMRQAGRSLPEYRAARGGTAMLEACRTPELVAEITVQPVRRYGVDAAVLYSDIVVPLHAAGVDVDIVPGTGPVVASPVRTAADVAALPGPDDLDLAFLVDAVRLTRAELGATPLLGFAGAPFTLASYLVEGGPSRDHARTKSLMLAEPDLFATLLSKVADLTSAFLRTQVEHGAAAVQLFDSWAGALARPDYERHVAPHSARVLAEVAEVPGADGRPVPRIHFGVGTQDLLVSMARAGGDVAGVDFHLTLADAVDRLAAAGLARPVQGNLDPALLLAPWDVVAARATDVLRDGLRAPGHVFNLGHGVLPATDPDQLARLTDLVHAFDRDAERERLGR